MPLTISASVLNAPFACDRAIGDQKEEIDKCLTNADNDNEEEVELGGLQDNRPHAVNADVERYVRKEAENTGADSGDTLQDLKSFAVQVLFRKFVDRSVLSKELLRNARPSTAGTGTQSYCIGHRPQDLIYEHERIWDMFTPKWVEIAQRY